jgi:hypothetical protein
LPLLPLFAHGKLRKSPQVDSFLLFVATVSRQAHLTIAIVATGLVATVPLFYGRVDGASNHARLSPEARLVAIRRAQVWKPTNIPAMDLKAGPKGPGAFAPNETVACDYIEKEMGGRSPKFTCILESEDGSKNKGDEVKIKYGKENGEVYGEVAATRLLWALGFGADRMYPVRVVCRNCPVDPHANSKPTAGQVTFDPAALEREAEGQILEDKEDSGWAFPDLDLVEETVGGAPPAHRDALKLLAVFIQHTDNKPEQQRLLCAPGERVGKDGEPCLHTFMMIHDLGLTFGHANVYNRASVGSVNFEQWSSGKVWSDRKACVGALSRSQTGTLDHPRIKEAGRKFLADLLVQLTDAQLHDLFEVARFPERMGGGRQATIDEWIGAFKEKRNEIVNTTCPE